MTRAVPLLFAVGVALGMAGCSASPPEAAPVAAAPVRAMLPLPDTPLLRLLRRSVASCEVDDFGTFTQCQDDYRFFDEIGVLEFEDLHAALALECRLLRDPDPELAGLALTRFGWITGALKLGGRISEVADEALLACLREHLDAPGKLDRRPLLVAYTEFSVGLGHDEQILAYLSGLTDPDLRGHGYGAVWKFAGMRLWPRLEPVVAAAEEGAASAVLASIRVDEFAEDEVKTLCAALAGWLHDPRRRVRAIALSQVVYDCPRYHPQVLAAARADLAREDMDSDLGWAISSLARNCIEAGPETCEEALALLEAIAVTPGVLADERTSAMINLNSVDRKRGQALAERLRGDESTGVADFAKEVLAQ